MSGNILVTVWFDYTCPHSHVGLGRLDTLSEELPLTIDRRPYLLRPDAPLNSVFVRDRLVEQPLSQEITGHRPPLKPPGFQSGAEPFSSRTLSTVLVHEATAFARDQCRDGEFYREVAGEYWTRGVDLGSIYTLRKSATRAGLDWDATWVKLESGHYRSWVMDEHQAAVDLGIKAAPSYLIDGAMYTGVGLAELRKVLVGAGLDH